MGHTLNIASCERFARSALSNPLRESTLARTCADAGIFIGAPAGQPEFNARRRSSALKEGQFSCTEKVLSWTPPKKTDECPKSRSCHHHAYARFPGFSGHPRSASFCLGHRCAIGPSRVIHSSLSIWFPATGEAGSVLMFGAANSQHDIVFRHAAMCYARAPPPQTWASIGECHDTTAHVRKIRKRAFVCDLSQRSVLGNAASPRDPSACFEPIPPR